MNPVCCLQDCDDNTQCCHDAQSYILHDIKTLKVIFPKNVPMYVHFCVTCAKRDDVKKLIYSIFTCCRCGKKCLDKGIELFSTEMICGMCLNNKNVGIILTEFGYLDHNQIGDLSWKKLHDLTTEIPRESYSLLDIDIRHVVALNIAYVRWKKREKELATQLYKTIKFICKATRGKKQFNIDESDSDDDYSDDFIWLSYLDALNVIRTFGIYDKKDICSLGEALQFMCDKYNTSNN